MTIISFRHNFLFVKTSKTAGTSIEVDLGRCVEREAVVTPIFPPSPAHEPRNYRQGDGVFFNHMTAAQIRDLTGADVFGRMVKFCVEREPVAKCISHFHMLRNSPLHNSGGTYDADWDGYCRGGNFPVDTAKYCDGDGDEAVVIVDRILRYETLQADLPDLLQGLGIGGFQLRAREKSDYAKARLISREQVTDAQRAIIDDAFSETRRLTGLY